MIDDIDRSILNILLSNGRISNAVVAREVGMAPSAVLERVRKLEARGVIQGYETRINPAEVGMGLLAFIFVRAEDSPGASETSAALAAIPEVLEVHHVAGEDCFLVKVRTRDTAALGDLLRDRFGAISTVRSTRTTIVLNTLKESMQLPLPAGPRES